MLKPTKFLPKLTVWCGNCNWRMEMNFIRPHIRDKNIDKLSLHRKDNYIRRELRHTKTGVYKCTGCGNLKNVELP